MATVTDDELEAIFDEISAGVFGNSGSAVDFPPDLDAYSYSPLTNPQRDIRVVELLLGEGDHPVEIRIFEQPLAEPPAIPSPRWTLRRLAETLHRIGRL